MCFIVFAIFVKVSFSTRPNDCSVAPWVKFRKYVWFWGYQKIHLAFWSMRNRYCHVWGKIEAICQQNNIAEIHFIMDKSGLHFSFYSISGHGSDFPTGSKQKWQKSHGHCLFPVGKSGNIRDIYQTYYKNKNIGLIYPLWSIFLQYHFWGKCFIYFFYDSKSVFS